MTRHVPLSRLLHVLVTGSCTLAFVACLAWTSRAPDARTAGYERLASRLLMAETLSRVAEPLREESRMRFGTHCAPCHGMAGQGGVGPNLTDDEWRHGGDLLSIRDSIRLGVEGTGMPAWRYSLSPREIFGMADHVTNVLHSAAPKS